MKKIFTLVAASLLAASAGAQDYTLRTLTFEDSDYASESANYLGVKNWSSLIDSPQYGGELLYGDNHGVTTSASTSVNYKWYDKGNTYLYSELPENWGTKMYWGGGHAISNYWDGNLSHGDHTNQLAVYVKDNQGNGTMGHGHNGSNNFAVHYGYRDNSGYSASNLPTLSFGDGVARVIDHMYVNINTYLANALINDNDLTSKLGADDYVAIEATGYKEDGSKKTITTHLAYGTDYIADHWTKWDMQELGKVKKVEFNVVGTSDNGYGFSMPAYFCYDDVAVQFPATTSTTSNTRPDNLPNAQSEDTSAELKKLTLIADWGENERFDGDVPEGATHHTINESPYDTGAFVSTDEGKTCEVTIGNLPAGITLEKIELTLGLSNVIFGEARLTGYVNDEAIGVFGIGAIRSNQPNKLPLGGSRHTITVFADKLPIKDTRSFKLKIEALKYDTSFSSIDLYYTVANPDGITETAADTKKLDNAYYDMQGRRIQAPQHGIYIHNGKKIVK